jgi:hypothetical protein
VFDCLDELLDIDLLVAVVVDFSDNLCDFWVGSIGDFASEDEGDLFLADASVAIAVEQFESFPQFLLPLLFLLL